VNVSIPTYSHKTSKKPMTENVSSELFFRHLHDQHEIMYFLSGKTNLITEDAVYTPRHGDLIFIPANTYHYTKILENEPYERIIINFNADEDMSVLLKDAFSLSPIINTLDIPQLKNFFNRFEDYSDRLKPHQFQILAPNLLKELLCLCTYNDALFSPHIEPAEKILKDALDYINQNIATIKNIQEIAEAVFVSSSYIYQLFQKKLHISPKKLLAQKRLVLAQSYISAGMSPYSTYQKCGYKDYSTFYRAYKAHFGHAPSLNHTNDL